MTSYNDKLVFLVLYSTKVFENLKKNFGAATEFFIFIFRDHMCRTKKVFPCFDMHEKLVTVVNIQSRVYSYNIEINLEIQFYRGNHFILIDYTVVKCRTNTSG